MHARPINGGSRRRSLILGLLLLIPCLPAAAQEPGAGSQERAEGAYVFVAGDVIEISVQPQQGFDRTLTIQPDGKIVLPVVGEITAAGVTVRQLTERLETGLGRELKGPRVTVSLKEVNKGALRRVSVTGAVKNPGVFELRDGAALPEVLAAAGGTTAAAELNRVTITRRGGTSPRGTADVVIQPGDAIFVPEGTPATIRVLGEVARPGSYELQGRLSLLDALALAGGTTSKADTARVTLTHLGAPESVRLDLHAALARGEVGRSEANIVLLPGDTVVVPENEQKYYILGEVLRADGYPFKPEHRVLDGIASAGGFTREADLTKVMLIRKGADGHPVGERLNLKRAMAPGDITGNPALQPGDMLVIPSRRSKRPITDSLGFLYPFSGLLSLFR